ncbi:MAG: aldose 1-epimerase [Bacteroidota bacterium]
MYKVLERVIENQDILFVQTENKDLIAKICLNEGGRIVQWYNSGVEVIGEPKSHTYAYSYAAAILVPFVNRIEGGTYAFKGQQYQLNVNEGGINAIHGLVYNRYFSLLKIDQKDNYTEIHSENTYLDELVGYPFSFKTKLIYRFGLKSLDINIQIENIGNKVLPYNLGWHPYFFVDDLSRSQFEFFGKKAFKTNDVGITRGSKEMEGEISLELSRLLDDAFLLEDKPVLLRTNKYQMELIFPDGENFLQVYTPENENYVAIEPMTGISNSFNNKIGFQELEPNCSISKEWNLNVQRN